MATDKHALKKLLKELETYRGRHTELVSVYIPAGYELSKIVSHLEQEAGTASNIKSASTRNNVIAAIEKMIGHLRLYKRTPDKGLAIFTGNVAEHEGASDVKVWSIEPPEELKIRLYRCDKQFVLDPLRDMIEIKEIYGMVVMDKREANIAMLRGKMIIHLMKITSNVPGKMKVGGQCLDPRTLVKANSQIAIHKLKAGDSIISYNFRKNKSEKSIILDVWKVKKGEIVEIKTEDGKKIISSKDHLFFIDDRKEKPAEFLNISDRLLKMFDGKLKPIKIKSITLVKKPTNLIDISVKNRNFLANGLVVHNSAHRFAENRELAAKDFYHRVAEHIKDKFFGNPQLKGLIIGGPGPTKYEFIDGDFLVTELKKKIIAVKDITYTDEFGLHELLERSQDVLAKEEVAEEKAIMLKFFENLAKKPNLVTYGLNEVKRFLDMGVVDTVLISEEMDEKIIEEIEDMAAKTKSIVKLISTETMEGKQLAQMGKIAAILRYEINM